MPWRSAQLINLLEPPVPPIPEGSTLVPEEIEPGAFTRMFLGRQAQVARMPFYDATVWTLRKGWGNQASALMPALPGLGHLTQRRRQWLAAWAPAWSEQVITLLEPPPPVEIPPGMGPVVPQSRELPPIRFQRPPVHQHWPWYDVVNAPPIPTPIVGWVPPNPLTRPPWHRYQDEVEVRFMPLVDPIPIVGWTAPNPLARPPLHAAVTTVVRTLVAGFPMYKAGVVYRYQNASNYWRAYLDGPRALVVLEKVVAGVVTEVATAAWTRTTTAEMRVIAQGNRHRVWVDFVKLIDATDAALNDQTRVGMYQVNNTAGRYDDHFGQGL